MEFFFSGHSNLEPSRLVLGLLVLGIEIPKLAQVVATEHRLKQHWREPGRNLLRQLAALAERRWFQDAIFTCNRQMWARKHILWKSEI